MRIILSIILLGIACSCGSTSSQTAETTQEVASTFAESPSHPDETKKVTIKSVEDSGYPFYWLSTETSEGTPLELKINLEEVGNLTAETLQNLVGKTTLIQYETQEEEAVMDIELNGKTLLGEYGGQKETGWNMVKGVLSAPEVSQGDLPGKMNLTISDGTSRQYEYYITDEVAQAHGKEVTIYYDNRKVYRVKSLLPQ